MNRVPSGAVNESFVGSNERRPASAYAATISGLPMKASVSGFPSLRRGKLRLNEVTIVFLVPGWISSRCH